MIFDSNGKLFGKISIVDIVVILVICLALAGVYIRFFRTSKTDTTTEEFYYTLKVEDVRKPTVDAIKKSIDYPFELNDKIISDMGTLVSTEFMPAKSEVTKLDGTVVEAEIPDKFDCILTFKINGQVNEKGYYTPQLSQIACGKTYVLKNRFVTFYGVITSIYQ